MTEPERLAKLVRDIQNLTHRVTSYSATDLKRHFNDRTKPRPKWLPARRKRAAEMMREWRRTITVHQKSQQSEKQATVDI